MRGLERQIQCLDELLNSVRTSEKEPGTELQRRQEELKSETRDELVEVRGLIVEARTKTQSIQEGINPVGK